MSRRVEPCRNFQRGSCQYGDRCKFLHVTQQQSKPNPFGFGAQNTSNFPIKSQQQKSNPFGFGVPNSSQPKGAQNFNPAKPFENKWIRPANSGPTQQTDTPPQAVTHTCTDPESCKRQIIEDLKNEFPLWKLTCYGHFKYLPCDIAGDISFEELRAAAYDDATRGLNLQSIVERERNLFSSKLIEFDNLLKNQHVLGNLTSAMASPFPATENSSLSLGAQNNAPPSFSSFSQLGASTDVGTNTRGLQPGTPPNTIFGQSNLFQNGNHQTSGSFGMNFGVPGVGNQQPAQQSRSFPGPSISTFNSGVVPNGSGLFSFPQQFPNSTNASTSFPSEPKAASNASHEAFIGEKHEDIVDASIWLKERWNTGEIPEEEPPQRFC